MKTEGVTDEMLALVGTTLDGRYAVDAWLGRGGMGSVYLARHIKLAKKVAIKVLRPDLVGRGEIAARFAREALTVGRLEHPHVASAVDVGELPGGGAYLVMQYVGGPSLRVAAAAKPGDIAFACEVGAQIADALSAAHASGIVHRDLKPENILLEAREGGAVHARVLDFGIAKVRSDETPTLAGAAVVPTEADAGLTRAGVVLGTPGYMPPEQATGEPVDESADLYALGVILWELVAARPLFPGYDLAAIVERQLAGPVPTLRSLREGVPEKLDTLIQGLLAARRAERIDSAKAVRDRLRALHREVEVQRERTAASETRPFPTPRSTAAAPSPPRASWAPIAVAVLLALGIVAWGALAPRGLRHAADTPRSREVASDAGSDVPPSLSQPTDAMDVVDAGASELWTDADERDLELLLIGVRETRRTVADAVLRRAAPTLLTLLARLERQEGCDAKRTALRELRELRDTRALPAVERIDRWPTTGCGAFGHSDCWACLRAETQRTLRSLDGERAVPLH